MFFCTASHEQVLQGAIKRVALALKVSPLSFCWCSFFAARLHTIIKGGGGTSISQLLGLAERSSAILAIECASKGGGGEDQTRAILAQGVCLIFESCCLWRGLLETAAPSSLSPTTGGDFVIAT